MVPIGKIDDLGSFTVASLVDVSDHSSMNIMWPCRA